MSKWLFFPLRGEVLAALRIIMMAAGLLTVTFWCPVPGIFQEAEFTPVGIFHLVPRGLSPEMLKFFGVLWPLACLTSLIGFKTRWSMLIAAVSGLILDGYHYNFGRVFHFNHLFMMLLVILALTPCGDQWSLDAVLRRRRGQPPPANPSDRYSWGLRLGQLYIVNFYFCTGLSKVLRSGWEWAWSENLAFKIMEAVLRNSTGDWLLMQDPLLLRAFAVSALTLELLSPLALLNANIGLLFVGGWISLHLGIHFAFGGHLLFFNQFFCYAFFVVPWLFQRRREDLATNPPSLANWVVQK